MRSTRTFVDLDFQPGQSVLLPTAPSTHLLRVLRLRPGDALTVFNGRGGEYTAELSGAEKSGARITVGSHDAVERESALTLTLFQGVARGERMDHIVQKATELGVQRVVPVWCEFSVVRLERAAQHRRREHWSLIAVAACEQCGRNRLPVIEEFAELADICTAAEGRAELKVVLVPQAPESLASLVYRSLKGGALHSASLLIGPEGGLSGRELALAQGGGFHAGRLGPRILRTETAPLAAVSAMQLLAGDWA